MRKLLTAIVLCLFLVAGSFAQGIQLERIGPKIGIINVSGSGGFDELGMGFQIGANVYLGEVSDNLYLATGVAYWSASEDVTGGEVTLSNIQIAPDVRYYVDGKELGLFFGGGVSINFLTAEVTVDLGPPFGSFTTDASDTEFGIHPIAGYVLEMNKILIFVEVKYNIISDFNTLDIAAGAQFELN